MRGAKSSVTWGAPSVPPRMQRPLVVACPRSLQAPVGPWCRCDLVFFWIPMSGTGWVLRTAFAQALEHSVLQTEAIASPCCAANCSL